MPGAVATNFGRHFPPEFVNGIFKSLGIPVEYEEGEVLSDDKLERLQARASAVLPRPMTSRALSCTPSPSLMTSASPKYSLGLASSSQMQPDATPTGGDKRDRILDAALMLFLCYGVKRTSIDAIAREVGIAKGTIYLSFDSKAALFAAIADRLCARIPSDAERI
ncbi:TetR/AcrR family transcriptional regulator [Paraburkholderia sp. D1E]|uniref:TetR/AcrR family transcriptional regulator n=1 Tax=Paraburkholderia sp. D1E TaxID=3461398 RepID=UPI0040467BF5